MGHCIGIDLGTTNSCAAVIENGKPVVIHNREGSRTTPSVVSFARDGAPLVGLPAKRQALITPKETIYGTKRLIGRKLASPEVKELQRTLPYTLCAAPNGDAWVEIRDRTLSPQEISAHVLSSLRESAQDYLGEPVSEAIITVPAYFNEAQRQATKDAAKIAGLDVRRLLNEPTAAALAHGIRDDHPARIAVFDLGGGTFDISLLDVSDGVFEVLATHGDTFLGGEDIDRAFVERLAADFQAETGHDVLGEPVALQRVREAAEQAKRELSSALLTSINLSFLAIGPQGPAHLVKEDVPRLLLEQIAKPFLERLEAPCLRALKDAGLKASDIDHVVLVGGMTRMPAVQACAERIFGRPVSQGVHPDEAVALGAAIQAGISLGEIEEQLLLDVTPHSLGIRTKGDRMSVVIQRNTRVPGRETRVFSPVEDGQDFVVVEVFEGEAETIDRNRYLGKFVLSSLPRAPKDQVHVHVSFTVDVNGLLTVSAREAKSGQAATVTIHPSGGLKPAEVDRLAALHQASIAAP
jgi:molecular chaperone DnaK